MKAQKSLICMFCMRTSWGKYEAEYKAELKQRKFLFLNYNMNPLKFEAL